MSKDPWIVREGQTCDGCSACCMHLGIPPFTELIGMFEWNDQTDADWFLMPLWIRLTIIAAYNAGRLEQLGMPCIFVDQKRNRCRIYKHRPSVCRNFEPGCEICIEDRQLLGIE